MSRRITSKGCLLAISLFLVVTQTVTLCGLAGVLLRPNKKTISLIVINYDNSFVAERAEEFDLPQVILQYEPVITAIEEYHKENGTYPADLAALVPKYLSAVPGIYIRNGEILTYKPEPRDYYATVAPFTFDIYGHYPGLASMHGWTLYYCPIEFDGCNDAGDRHFRQFRINDRWIWINSSAL